jgi:hypothetical protein
MRNPSARTIYTAQPVSKGASYYTALSTSLPCLLQVVRKLYRTQERPDFLLRSQDTHVGLKTILHHATEIVLHFSTFTKDRNGRPCDFSDSQHMSGCCFCQGKKKVKGLYDAFSGLLISKVTADPEHMSSWVGVVSTSKPTG